MCAASIIVIFSHTFSPATQPFAVVMRHAQAKCLAAQATQIEDLLVAAEERQHLTRGSSSPPLSAATGVPAEVSPPRPRLVFSRRSKSTGFWLWDFLSGGGKTRRRHRSTPKGVLHQIAAETPSLAAVPSAELALEIIRRTLGIEMPGPRREHHQESGASVNRRNRANVAVEMVAASLTWDLMEAAFKPVAEEGAGQEATGLATRLDRGGMHGHALQVLLRVRELEARGLEARARVPSNVRALAAVVRDMEAGRVLARTDAENRWVLNTQPVQMPVWVLR